MNPETLKLEKDYEVIINWLDDELGYSDLEDSEFLTDPMGIVKTERQKNERLYFCRGYCLPTYSFKSPDAVNAARSFGKCEKLEIERHVIINGKRTSRNFNHRAKSIFARDYLVDFCKEASKVGFYYYSSSRNSGNNNLDVKRHHYINVCVAYGIPSELPNVHCHIVEDASER